MNEQEVRRSIIKWSKQHFAPERGDPTPDVEIISISYDKAEDEWQAELSISTSADNPHITFFMHDLHGLQIASIEY